MNFRLLLLFGLLLLHVMLWCVVSFEVLLCCGTSCYGAVNCFTLNVSGRTALHWAAAVNNIEVAKLLLRRGANRDLQDNNDETPLFLAVKNGRFEMAKLLLENLANSNIPNDMNQMPRNIAAERRYGNIVELLDNFQMRPLLSVTNGQTSDVVLPPYIQSMVKKNQKNLAAKSPDSEVPDHSEVGVSERRPSSTNRPRSKPVRVVAQIEHNVRDSDVCIIEDADRSADVEDTSSSLVSTAQKREEQRRKLTKSARDGKTRVRSAENVKYPKKKSEPGASGGVRERRNSQKSPAICNGRRGGDESAAQESEFAKSHCISADKTGSRTTLSCNFDRGGADRLLCPQQNHFDENRNVAFDVRLSRNACGSSNSQPAQWPGTLSPPDSTCCVSPIAGSSSIGSPETNFPGVGSNLRSPGMNCVSGAPVTYYPNSRTPVESDPAVTVASFSPQTLGVQGLALHQYAAGLNRVPDSRCHFSGTYQTQPKELFASYNTHISCPSGYSAVGGTPNYTLVSSGPTWDTPVQYHMINGGVTYDICLTPSPDDSTSFQIE